MRIAALDIGKKRTGIALSDAAATFASPYCVVPTAELTQARGKLAQLLEEEKVDHIVVGLPLTKAGAKNEQADYTTRVAKQLAQTFQVDVTFQDERLTSVEAKRIMHDACYSEREMRGKLDAIAASLLLETYLEKRKATS